MISMKYRRKNKRRGAIAVLAAFVLILFVGMLAFTIDYARLTHARNDLQRAADAAALAAVQDLMPQDENLTQGFTGAEDRVRAFVRSNLGNDSFAVDSADIEMGRFVPYLSYSDFTMVNNGTFDTIRVTLRRDGSINPLVSLFFGQALGVRQAAVSATATAVLQKSQLLLPGSGVLPFGIPKDEWDNVDVGDEWSIYGDGKIEDDEGDEVPGNWGTVDIGDSNNSTSDLRDQITDGLRQSDIDALYDENRIDTTTHIDPKDTMWLNADTGLSSGMQSAIEAVHSETRIAPLYDSVSGNGNNTEFRIVGWGVVTVVDSHFQGNKNTYVTIRKALLYDGLLGATNRLDADVVFEGNYTSPVLVE